MIASCVFTRRQINLLLSKPGVTMLDLDDTISDPEFDALLPLEPDVAVDDDLDFVPTDARPGSDEKLDVMRQRYETGQPLFHPDDETSQIVKMSDGHGGYRYIEIDEDEDD